MALHVRVSVCVCRECVRVCECVHTRQWAGRVRADSALRVRECTCLRACVWSCVRVACVFECVEDVCARERESVGSVCMSVCVSRECVYVHLCMSVGTTKGYHHLLQADDIQCGLRALA